MQNLTTSGKPRHLERSERSPDSGTVPLSRDLTAFEMKFTVYLNDFIVKIAMGVI
jgi:hypothetical protein